MSVARSLRICVAAALLLVGCTRGTERTAGAPLGVERRPPGFAGEEPRARGWRAPLPDARLFVPEGVGPTERGTVPLLLHFQGGAKVAEENLVRMDRPGVSIASTLAGFSSAFRRPYEDPSALDDLLAAGEAALAERWGRDVRFEPVTITFFSAGYGAVREFLREPRHFDRIDALVAADSIYASLAAPDVRAPRAEQMEGFVRFAQAAARGEKTFALVHTEIVTEYASTAECAAMLLAAVDGRREALGTITDRGVPIADEVHVGRFHLFRVEEATASSHMDCLYMIPELVRRFVPTEAMNTAPAPR